MTFYKHRQHIVPNYCTKYEQNQLILLWDITTNTQNAWTSGHNDSNLVQGQMIFYKHEQCMVPDNCTKYKQNTTFFEISQQTLKIYEKIAIITQIWHKAKFYFICISSLCYLIMVPNMKKSIQPSWIPRQIHRLTDGLDSFLYSPIPLIRRSGE